VRVGPILCVASVGCGSVSASHLSPTVGVGCQLDDCSTLAVDVFFPDDADPIGGDQLVYKFRDLTMHPRDHGGDYLGLLALDTPPMTDEVVTVIFHVDTTVELDLVLPGRFDNIEMPLFASRASDLVITWSDATPSDHVAWAVTDSDCVLGMPTPLASDTGTLTIPANTLQLADVDKGSHETCTTSLGLAVKRDFDPDPAFESAMVQVVLRKQVTFASMP
jgi:hypothetical protein